MKITVIGAGYVGGQIADRLVFGKLANKVILIDTYKDLALAKAEDISHAINIYKLDCKITGTDDFSFCKDSNIVVITAGISRKPGMARDNLAKTNKDIITQITKEVVKFAPDSIIIVVTNPVDIMTYFVYHYSGFDKSKVIGMAGVLDSGRLSHIISKTSDNLRPNNIDAMVIGPHGNSMICLGEYIKIKNRKIYDVFSCDKTENIFNNVSNAGADLISLYKGNSAFFGPSAGVARMVELISKDSLDVVPCSVLLDGEYGVKDVCLGVPVILGSGGIKKIIELDLSQEEKTKFLNISETYRQKIEKLKGV